MSNHISKMQALAADLEERSDLLWMMQRVVPDGGDETTSNMVALMALSDDGHLLVVEATMTNDGQPQVVVRLFDADFEPAAPTILDVGDSTLITTPTAGQ